MATKPISFIAIKSGWDVSYYFMTEAGYDYTVTLTDKSTGTIYGTWTKNEDGDASIYKYSSSFQYTGPDGELICVVDCPESQKLDNSFSANVITPNAGSPTLGYTYCAAFEDFGGSIDYNDFFVCLVGWTHEG